MVTIGLTLVVKIDFGVVVKMGLTVVGAIGLIVVVKIGLTLVIVVAGVFEAVVITTLLLRDDFIALTSGNFP